MRTLLFVIVSLHTTLFAFSQHNTDSLIHIITTSKDVQTRVEAARHYTWRYAFKGADSATHCANRLIQIGQSKKYDDITAMGKSYLAYSATITNETYRALTINIEALKLAEKVQNDLLFAFVYNCYGIIYSTFNKEKSMEYYRKTRRYLETLM
jgi:hypothetical protein